MLGLDQVCYRIQVEPALLISSLTNTRLEQFSVSLSGRNRKEKVRKWKKKLLGSSKAVKAADNGKNEAVVWCRRVYFETKRPWRTHTKTQENPERLKYAKENHFWLWCHGTRALDWSLWAQDTYSMVGIALLCCTEPLLGSALGDVFAHTPSSSYQWVVCATPPCWLLLVSKYKLSLHPIINWKCFTTARSICCS